MKFLSTSFVASLLLFTACASFKKASNTPLTINLDTLRMPVSELPSNALKDQQMYRASERRLNDLIHTSLEIKPDFDKKFLYGKATLSLKPYFHPTDSLALDAKGLDINEVSMILDSERKKVKFSYDSLKLKITLDRTYKRNETYQIFIDYTAKPELLKNKGSAAITDTKGLYFINADGKDGNKPKQVWSQGETEYNSAWFPTIDSPNERMTQEISITVDTSFTTLSNGLLMYSKFNDDGTRTDLWKQSLGAAPYLSMFAVGKFAIIRDKWKNIEVSYYLDPEYASVGKKIFGNTPEMINFFSSKLGVDYPWEKYAEIVVHDYVSGAMENTGAVIFGDFMQRNNRELLDNTNEDVISHELFHHWFGDLVTCESWSNLPLNESFATYGEYLWNDYKYGREEADFGIQSDLKAYLNSAGRGNEPKLIRFQYEDKEEMFDAISYQKGGRILHMLRKYVGDDAFFQSLKLYLQNNKFNAVEMHQLRLAFEQITGEDLNWFFNQWFLGNGHPLIDIQSEYIDSLKEQRARITQKQDLTKFRLFRLPIKIDLYSAAGVQSHSVTIEKEEEVFSFKTDKKPELVNVDAEKMLLCEKTENKTKAEYTYQYFHAPLYLDRFEAIQNLKNEISPDSITSACLVSALSDKFWNIRLLALDAIENLLARQKDSLLPILKNMAINDKKSVVRGQALQKLATYYKEANLKDLFSSACSDSSYTVAAAGILSLARTDAKEGLSVAKKMELEFNTSLQAAIAQVYVQYGGHEQETYFIRALENEKTKDKTTVIYYYGKFIMEKDSTILNRGIQILEKEAKTGKIWHEKLTATNSLEMLKTHFEKLANDAQAESESQKKLGKTDQTIENTYNKNTKISLFIEEKIQSIKNQETNEMLKGIYLGK